jgi:hypothetical protein
MGYDREKFTNSSTEQLDARDELYTIFENYNAPKDEKERSLSLFLRGSQLARILAVNDIYKQIVGLPGNIFDFGTWRGSTAVLCENFRAIHEPLNFQRHIFAFDTFEGYKGFGDNEAKVQNISNGTYGVEENYEKTLTKLLLLHEQNNAMGHINNKHSVIKGDVTKTLPALLQENQGLSIALAFFDLNCYEPTTLVLQHTLERLLVGGIIAVWQFSRLEIQAESKAFFDLVHNNLSYTIHTSDTYPSLVYIKKEK